MTAPAGGSDADFCPAIAEGDLTPDATAAVLGASVNVILGAAAAWRSRGADSGYERAAARSSPGPVRLWGAGRALQPGRAALLNAALGHHFSFDDTADVLLGHPGVALVPALLAAPGTGSLTAGRYVAAFASGYECMVQLARVLNPGHYRHGHHATATLGTLGAALAVAVAAGADAPRRLAAVGIAASRAGGLRAAVGHDLRAWHAGFAAEQGLESALLALDGVRTHPQPLTSEFGFLRVFGPGPQDGDGLPSGEPALNGPAVLNLKEYPGCGALAPALSALDAALGELGAAATDVVSVDVDVAPFVLEVVHDRWPREVADAGFSLRFALATTLRHGRLGPEHFTAGALADDAAAAAGRLVTIAAADLGGTKYESVVTVRTRDGRLARARRPGVGGRPASRFGATDITARWAGSWPTRSGAIEHAAREFVCGAAAPLAARLEPLLDAVEGP